MKLKDITDYNSMQLDIGTQFEKVSCINEYDNFKDRSSFTDVKHKLKDNIENKLSMIIKMSTYESIVRRVTNKQEVLTHNKARLSEYIEFQYHGKRQENLLHNP